MSYIALSILVIVAYVLALRLSRVDDYLNVYGVWGGVLFFIMWMHFCVISRRMHDVGRTKQLALVLFALTFFTHLACLDPNLLGKDEATQEYWAEILGLVSQLARIGWMFISVELLRQEGEAGPNMFGPEFGAAGIRTAKLERARGALPESYGSTNRVLTVNSSPAVATMDNNPIEPAARRIGTLASRPARPGFSTRKSASKSMRQPTSYDFDSR
jgi:uncharacterized membrane protein YhaH (DUF805 family)